MSARLARLVLPGMAFADIADQGQELALPEAEAVHVATAGEKRRRDFTFGRLCARTALEKLGTPVPALAMGPRGAPLWPEGVYGSITHTRGYAACIVARGTDFAALGLDAEQVDGVTPQLHRKLFGDEERAVLAGLGEAEARRAAAVMFSAKEAYYKACLARFGALPWRSLCVTLKPDGFSVRDEWAGEAAGRFIIAEGLVVTLVAVPA